jgi:hypothetical protein
MVLTSAEEIPGILVARGWTPRSLDKRTWRCTIPTSAGNVRIVVRHAGSWLYMVVMPFLEPESVKPWGAGKYPARFLGRILAVNANLSLVKFALDDDGDLTLRVELPTESLQAREIETALHLLHMTTEQYRVPIREALLDAGRAAERPSVLPDAPLSTPPDESDDHLEGTADAVIALSGAALEEPDEPSPDRGAKHAAPLRSDPPPPDSK